MDMYDNQNTYPGVTFFGDMCICIKTKSYNKGYKNKVRGE